MTFTNATRERKTLGILYANGKNTCSTITILSFGISGHTMFQRETLYLVVIHYHKDEVDKEGLEICSGCPDGKLNKLWTLKDLVSALQMISNV